MAERGKPEGTQDTKNVAGGASDDATSGGATRGKLKKFALPAALGLVVIGASVGGSLVVLQSGDATVAVESTEAPPPDTSSVQAVAIYHNLRPAFIVDFLAGNKPRYLQAELTVVSRRPSVIESVIAHTPMIRNEILNIFADQDYAMLQTEEGKQALRALLKERIDAVLTREKQPAGVESVLLTNFVMQ